MDLDYRMYSNGIPAGENAVEIIQKHLEEQGQVRTDKLVLDFVGFEAAPGTTFTLNNQKDKIAIPNSGYFISPHCGNSYMKIRKLVFDEEFSGNIYYIV